MTSHDWILKYIVLLCILNFRPESDVCAE